MYMYVFRKWYIFRQDARSLEHLRIYLNNTGSGSTNGRVYIVLGMSWQKKKEATKQ